MKQVRAIGLVAVVAVCWVLFTIGSLLASVFGLLALPLRQHRYAANVLHALDCTCAALLRWSGRKTISKECGEELVAQDNGGPKACRFCRIVCRILHPFDPDHCRKQVRS